MPRGNRNGRNGDDGDDDRQDEGIIIGPLGIFLNLRVKVNNLTHILWNLKTTW